MKIGLIKERKLPADRRVALSPSTAKALSLDFPEVEILVERSEDRVFTDSDYEFLGLKVVDNASECDVLLGVKEVPISDLLPGKTYFFFSHTHKKQEYNRKLLRAMVDKGVRMIDYECLEWPTGGRILGFGRWAGIVGVYNAFLTWGMRYDSFILKPAYLCKDYAELLNELRKVETPAIKIALTGTGRVAGGALEVLNHMGIREKSPIEYLSQSFDYPVFANLKNEDIYRRIGKDSSFDKSHFYANHKDYEATFDRFIPHTDLLINGMYWEDDLAPLFSKEDTSRDDFKIEVIADITCDVEGSIPITMWATTINEPVLAWDRIGQKVAEPYGKGVIDVMAVTNLPTELPSDASEDFGAVLAAEVLPLLVNGDPDNILKNATLCEQGKLTEKYSYLQPFIDGE